MKTAVVTGASGGIGLETARALLADGWQVVCLSRHACPLEGVRSMPCDITDSAQVQAAFAAVDRVDLLVNNAGFGISGAVECTGEAEMRRQFDLNFFAWVTVIQAALPALRESRGRILNISSAAAVFSIPFQSFYSATKAAVESLTCALRSELAPFGITVGALRLGDVKTGFTAARQKSGSGDDLYAGRIARSVAVMERDEQNGMPPAAIATAVVRAAHKKRLPPVTTVGNKYKLLCSLLHKALRLFNQILHRHTSVTASDRWNDTVGTVFIAPLRYLKVSEMPSCGNNTLCLYAGKSL